MYRNEQVMKKTSCSQFTCFLGRHYWIGSSKTWVYRSAGVIKVISHLFVWPVTLHKPEGKPVEETGGTTAPVFLWFASVLYFLERLLLKMYTHTDTYHFS